MSCVTTTKPSAVSGIRRIAGLGKKSGQNPCGLWAGGKTPSAVRFGNPPNINHKGIRHVRSFQKIRHRGSCHGHRLHRVLPRSSGCVRVSRSQLATERHPRRAAAGRATDVSAKCPHANSDVRQSAAGTCPVCIVASVLQTAIREDPEPSRSCRRQLSASRQPGR